MGGFGSGRRDGKRCTDDMRHVDVRRLKRGGYLKPGMTYDRQWSSYGEIKARINLSVQAEQVVLSYRDQTGASPCVQTMPPVGLSMRAGKLR